MSFRSDSGFPGQSPPAEPAAEKCSSIAVSRLLVRPSCTKNRRWPIPPSGVVRKLIRTGFALNDVVSQACTHVMEQQVGVRIHVLATQRDHVRPDFFVVIGDVIEVIDSIQVARRRPARPGKRQKAGAGRKPAAIIQAQADLHGSGRAVNDYWSRRIWREI